MALLWGNSGDGGAVDAQHVELRIHPPFNVLVELLIEENAKRFCIVGSAGQRSHTVASSLGFADRGALVQNLSLQFSSLGIVNYVWFHKVLYSH